MNHAIAKGVLALKYCSHQSLHTVNKPHGVASQAVLRRNATEPLGNLKPCMIGFPSI